jgi:hypothetical protein
VEPVRQAKSQASKPRPSTANAEQPRSLGSAPALGRSITIPANTKKAQAQDQAIPAPPPVKPSALGLDLGTELRPAPHRQLSALRRPALTPGSSAENLLAPAPLTLGRRSRDPSMTDLMKTRFEPATYPLPESKSSVGTKRTEVTDEDLAGKVKKGKKGMVDVPEVSQVEVIQEGPAPEIPIVDTAPITRRITPEKIKRTTVEPTPPQITPDTLALLSPRSPDFLTPQTLTPTPTLERHTLPRGITSRVAHDDRVSFEVPNGTRGRLRVSLAWVRDRATRSNTLTPSDAPPPPLPPKSPPGRYRSRKRDYDLVKVKEKEQRRPSPYPSVSATSPPLSPRPDLRPRPQANNDPYFAQAARPYHAPPVAGMTNYPLGRPFAYPQPEPPPQPQPAWASMPHLAPQQAQMQMPMQGMNMGMGLGYAPHLAQSAESFEPPSARNSPIPGMMSLPNVGMGISVGMPMGMAQGPMQGYGRTQAQAQVQTHGQGQGRSQMGIGGMQNGVNPYSNLSLAQQQQQNHLQYPSQNQHQDWQGHEQEHQQGQMSYGQGQGQGPSRNPYQLGNYRNGAINNGDGGNRQSIWKRMLNSNFNPGNRGNGNVNGNGTGYRVNRNAQGQYEAHDDHDQTQNQTQAYGGRQQYRGWGGGNDNKIGKWIRGVTPGRAPPRDRLGLGLGLKGNVNVEVRDRKNYKLSQPIWGRRKQYDGPINPQTGGIDRNQGKMGRQGGGGMMNWFNQNNGNRLQGRNQRNALGNGNDGYYSTNRPRNNIYGNDPFRSDDRDAKRRQKAERRNDREDRARRQIQAQAQGRRGQRKWKDRLPRNRNQTPTRERERERGRQDGPVYGQGRGTTGTGLFGNWFR